jgi:hypothetical protein
MPKSFHRPLIALIGSKSGCIILCQLTSTTLICVMPITEKFVLRWCRNGRLQLWRPTVCRWEPWLFAGDIRRLLFRGVTANALKLFRFDLCYVAIVRRLRRLLLRRFLLLLMSRRFRSSLGLLLLLLLEHRHSLF